MTTVAIAGAGEIGGATAQALAFDDRVARVWLVDPAEGAAAGKALDLQQSGAIHGSHARFGGTADMTRIAGCDVCVVADPMGRSPAEWQGEEGLTLVKRLASYLAETPLVFAGATPGDLMSAAAREARLPRERLIGSAPEAFASAVAAVIAMEARCSSTEVRLAVLGKPPAGFVVAWSDASIGGYPLEKSLSQVQLTRIQARVARLWPPGPYVLGAAAARVTEAILGSSRRFFSVLTQLGGEFGVRNRTGALPVLLGPRGITATRVPTLATRERVQVETALGA